MLQSGEITYASYIQDGDARREEIKSCQVGQKAGSVGYAQCSERILTFYC